MDIEVFGIRRRRIETPFRTLQTDRINVGDLMAARRQLTAELDLEWMTCEIMYQAAHKFRPNHRLKPVPPKQPRVSRGARSLSPGIPRECRSRTPPEDFRSAGEPARSGFFACIG